MLRGFVQWLSDGFRLLGGAFYWNLRKSAYVLRRRRGRCPCQNESDDAVPGRVRCDAMLHWHQPARFRRICPLLVETPDGWRCSVPTTEVRPYWGRVLAWSAASLAAVYPAGVVVVFLFFRFVSDAPITFAQVAWPSRWPEIRRVQSEQFLTGAAQALAQGKLSEAYLSLTSARERDPSNYLAALLLAKLAMFQGSVLYADEQFAEIMASHAAERDATAIFYHDTLVQADRMPRLGQFCLQMAASDPAHAALWVRSALLAVRSMPPAEVRLLQKSAGTVLPKLAPHAQRLLEAEFALRNGSNAEALRILRAPFGSPVNAFYTSYQIVRCAELGDGAQAQLLLDFHAPALGAFETELVQFRIARFARDQTAATAALNRLLAMELNELRVERLLGALILQPDAAHYRAISQRVRRDRLLEATNDGGGLWVAGLVCGDRTEAAYWTTHGKPGAHAALAKLDRVDFSTRDPRKENSPLHLINVLGLPREIIDALLQRTAPQTDAAPATDSKAG